MIHVVSFSTGLSSALAVERVASAIPFEAIRVVFMDTLIEDDDNYRFAADMGERWRRLYGLEVTTLTEGRTPFQVAEDQNIIPNQKIAPCTFKLKIEPFRQYLKSLDDSVTVHIGYDFSEVHRCKATRVAYEREGYSVDFPLLWRPVETRPYTEVCYRDWDINPPRMYGMGYSHANCGGRCVKQGIGDWLRTLEYFPARFAEVEAWEAGMRDHETRGAYAMLRDQSGGQVTALPLDELRERHKQTNAGQLSLFDYHDSCIVCGIGDFTGGAE